MVATCCEMKVRYYNVFKKRQRNNDKCCKAIERNSMITKYERDRKLFFFFNLQGSDRSRQEMLGKSRKFKNCVNLENYREFSATPEMP